MVKFLLLFLSVLLSCFSQETWNALKFGMKLHEAREALAKQGLAVEPSLEGWQVKPLWKLEIPDVKIPFRFSPIMLFSQSGILNGITLELQLDEKSEGRSVRTITTLAAKYIHNQLTGRYGDPVVKKGICDDVQTRHLSNNPDEVGCSAIWKATHQTISLDWIYVERRKPTPDPELLFTITYRPVLNTGL